MSRGLIVVDVQNDFCEGGSISVAGGARIATKIAELVEQSAGGDYQYIVATRDHHIDPEAGGHFSETPDFQECRTVPDLCAVRGREQLRGGRRGAGVAGHSDHIGLAGSPDRPALRADPGRGRSPCPAREMSCPAAARCGGDRLDTAVTLLITVGDNPERLDSEASFAALCGVGPVERSSGRRQFRRLNRGGDRQANAALHRIVFTRLRVDPRTQYVATTSAGSRRVRPVAKSSVASSAMRPGRSSTWSNSYSQDPDHRGCVTRDGLAAGPVGRVPTGCLSVPQRRGPLRDPAAASANASIARSGRRCRLGHPLRTGPNARMLVPCLVL